MTFSSIHKNTRLYFLINIQKQFVLFICFSFIIDLLFQDEDNILPPDDDDDGCLENEEEYDALNDETFGAVEDLSELDDWEQQHEQFAEIAETSRYSEQIGKLCYF